MYDTITNYNDRNQTPLFNNNIREVIDQVILEEQGEENNITADTSSPQRNEIENLIDKVANFTIDDVGNDQIKKVVNLTINDVRNNLINKVANLTINDVRNDSNRATTSDAQVHFVGDSAGISHQNLLIRHIIRIRHEEVPVLVPPTEPNITANNQLDMIVSTGVIQAPQALKTPEMQRYISVTAPYNTGENRNPHIVSRNSVDGYT